MYNAPSISEAKCFSCGGPALYHYEWPWGEQGYSCTPHLSEIRGIATKLSREVAITSLLGPAPDEPSSGEVIESLRQELSKTRSELMATALDLDQTRSEIEQLLHQISAKQLQLDELRAGHPGS